MNRLCRIIVMALALLAATAEAGQSYLVTDRFAGSILQLEDINGDGDALDVGERALWGDGLTNAAELSRYKTGFLVVDSIAARVRYYEDSNSDGDALDAGESIIWADGLANPFGIDVASDGSAYLSDFSTHQVFRAQDLNADGDALDANERLLYADNIQGAVSVLADANEQYVVAFNTGQVHALRDKNGDGDALDAGENLPHTPNTILQVEGIAPRAGGGYFTGSWVDDMVYRVIDRNGDGDALDAAEVLPYADSFFGTVISNPWGLVPGSADELLVANSSGANILALRDKNHDGDALDLGEVVVFADGISSPVDIVTLPSRLPGDFNNDGTVDAADYVVWRNGIGVAPTPDNYNLWRANFGRTQGGAASATANAVAPEPSAAWLMILGIILTQLQRIKARF